MERLIKLQELKQVLESGSENWPDLLALELYFYGDNISSCRCKTGQIRSRLNQYYELHKGELL